MTQPNDPVFLMDRPGGHQVPVLVDGGRAMRVSEKSKYRRQITELQQRTQAARNQT